VREELRRRDLRSQSSLDRATEQAQALRAENERLRQELMLKGQMLTAVSDSASKVIHAG
jgi:cell shape-determining protein MreC